MKKLMKKGAFNVALAMESVFVLILGIILIFNMLGSSAPNLTNASGNVAASGLPLATLFNSNGIVLLAFMGGVVLLVVTAAMKFHKK